MTRFQQELNGTLGEYWKKQALAKIERMKIRIESGEILFNDGVPRWKSSGNILPRDVVEVMMYCTDKIDVEKTDEERDRQDKGQIEQYKKHQKPISEEELFEMQSAFGTGTTVVDVISGRKIQL